MDIGEEPPLPEDLIAGGSQDWPMEANSRITSDVEKATSGRYYNKTVEGQ
jgi:hypothetical protein